MVVSSPLQSSVTNKIGKSFCEAYAGAFTRDKIRYINVSDGHLPPITSTCVRAKFMAYSGGDKCGSEEWQKTLNLIDAFKAADKLVILAPMWNTNIPAELKLYFDHIVQPHQTFNPDTAEGLMKGKPVLLVRASRDIPIGSANDSGTPYMLGILGFLGFTDVRRIDYTGSSSSQLLRDKCVEAERMAHQFVFKDSATLPVLLPRLPTLEMDSRLRIKRHSKIFCVTSSPMASRSTSKRVVSDFLQEVEDQVEGVELTVLDLGGMMSGDNHLRPFTAAEVNAKLGYADPQVQHSANEEVKYSMELIRKFKDADMYVFAVPMWNLGIPYILKRWIDHVVQPNETFDPISQRGLLNGRPAFCVASSGNGLLGTSLDHLSPMMKQFFHLVGIGPVAYTYLNGTSGERAAELVSEATRNMKRQAGMS